MSATAFGPIEERNEDATLKCSNLSTEVDDEVLWEFMMQAGPLKSCHIVRDRTTDESTGVAYVEFKVEEDAMYATKVLNMIKLFGQPVRLSKCGEDGPAQYIDIGANIFVGGLDPAVDEGMLVETFSSFGTLSTQPRVIRDDQGISKGGGLVYFDSFEAADKAIEAMNGQFLFNRKVRVHYAKKKDSDERHGTESQRFLASKMNKAKNMDFMGTRTNFVPNQYFSDGLGRPITGAGEDGAFMTAAVAGAVGAPAPAAAPPAGYPPGVPQPPPLPAPGYGAMPQGMPAAPMPPHYGQPPMPPGMPPAPPVGGYPPQPPMGYAPDAAGAYPPAAPPGMPPMPQYDQMYPPGMPPIPPHPQW